MTTTRTASHTVTLVSDGATVLATITDANGAEVAAFTTADSDGFIGRLDRKMGRVGYRRNGYTSANRVMTATVDGHLA